MGPDRRRRLAGRAGVVALGVVAAAVALALVPHAYGGFGGPAVVTDPGPPPSVDAGYDDPRQRFQNRVTNQAVALAPVAVAGAGAVVAFLLGRRGPRPDEPPAGERARWGVVGADATGAFLGAAAGYALFVGGSWFAYGAIPGGYVLESYPPTIRALALAVDAVALGAATAVGSAVAGVAGRRLGGDVVQG